MIVYCILLDEVLISLNCFGCCEYCDLWPITRGNIYFTMDKRYTSCIQVIASLWLWEDIPPPIYHAEQKQNC